MKKIKLDGKLSLNKETVSRLNDEQMKRINGGFTSFACSIIFCGGGGATRNNCPTRVGCPPPPSADCPTQGFDCESQNGSVCQSACNGNYCP